jgi:hypothetical protein
VCLGIRLRSLTGENAVQLPERADES